MMTPAFDFHNTPGTVLVCTLDGKIAQVVQDQLGWSSRVEVGRLLSSIVERESFGKMLNFLLEIREQGSTFDWQMNVALHDTIETLNFAGMIFEERLVILAAQSRNHMLGLYEELMRISNEQVNELRAVLKDQSSSSLSHSAQDDHYYDELTKLYNELANLQRDVAKKNVALERLNEQKNRFLGMAAHDLRNPLNAIMMYSEFLLDEVAASLDEEHHEFLRVIRTSSEFMLHLVEDFLDIATIESGKLHLNLWPVNVTALVRENIALNTLLASRKEIALQAEYRGEVPEILADASKIEQVLNNLISNAVKYSPAGTVVTVTLDATAEAVVVTVTDQGPGIPADELERIFEPFERSSVKSTNGEKSSGLGLAIARKIVMEHHGTLTARNNDGRGTTFCMTLPRDMPDDLEERA